MPSSRFVAVIVNITKYLKVDSHPKYTSTAHRDLAKEPTSEADTQHRRAKVHRTRPFYWKKIQVTSAAAREPARCLKNKRACVHVEARTQGNIRKNIQYRQQSARVDSYIQCTRSDGGASLHHHAAESMRASGTAPRRPAAVHVLRFLLGISDIYVSCR